MSRIRSIQPGFFTDEDIVSVSMAARLLIVGLGVEADDKGVFPWKPLTYKMRLFPADNVDIAEMLGELESVGLVRKFDNEGKSFGVIKNFRKHQRPKKPNDIHPLPRDLRTYAGLTDDSSEPVPNQFRTSSEKSPQMEGRGEEDVGESPPTPQGDGERVPIGDDWSPPSLDDLSPQARACAKAWSDASYQAHAEAFRNHWKAKRAKSSDWNAKWADRVVTLHGQVMRDEKQGNAPPSAASGKSQTPEEWLAYCEDRVKFWTGSGKKDELAHWRQAEQLARSKVHDPPALQAVN